MIFLAYAPGKKIINLLTNDELTQLEKIIFSVSLGLGFTASGFILLGVVGLFKPLWMVIWILALAVWSRSGLIAPFKNIPIHTRCVIRFWKEANYQGKGLIILSGLILIMTYLQALTPPWDEDGLMYHMEAPRRFLEAGQIIFIPENYQANFPMLSEMLFALGIGLGLDQLAKLIQLFYGILLVLGTYALGERCIGEKKGWLPAAILISTPMVIALASFTYTDLTWALYTLLSVYTILIWYRSRDNSWLIIAGIFSGFMIGSKYLGLGSILILSIIILWNIKKSSISTWIKTLLTYGGIAFLIGGFWYLKNLVLTGNPVYPFFFGGFDMSLDQLKISSKYLKSFGTGDRITDYLLLPINIYIQQIRFSTYLGELEIPNILFLLTTTFPFIRRKSNSLKILFVIAVFGFIFWSLGTLQNRLLLPLFPLLSILSAKILFEFSVRLPYERLKKVFVPGIIGGLLIFSLIIEVNKFNWIQPQKNILGNETRDDFLFRMTEKGIVNFNIMSFIQSEMSLDDKILMIWSRQTYYCAGRCIPDTDHSYWPYIFSKSKMDKKEISEELNRIGVTHLLINNLLIANLMPVQGPSDSSVTTIYSDLHKESYHYLIYEFIPTCTKEVYRDQYEIIYELNC